MPIDLAKQRLAKIEANPPKPGADETAFLEDKRKVRSLHGAKCMQMGAQAAIIVQWVSALCVRACACASVCTCTCMFMFMFMFMCMCMCACACAWHACVARLCRQA